MVKSNIQGILEWIVRTIGDFKFTILLFLFLCFIAIYPAYPLTLWWMIPSVLNAFVVICIFQLMARIRLRMLMVILITIFIGINAYFAVLHQSYLNIGLFASVMETNFYEAISAFKAFGLQAIALVAAIFFVVYKSYNELRKVKAPLSRPLTIVIVYSFFLFPMMVYRNIAHDYNKAFLFRNKPRFVSHLVVQEYAPLLYSNISLFMTYKEQMDSFKNYVAADRDMPQGLSISAEEMDEVEKIYVIIGESANPWRHSVYGYNKPTTPFLDSLKKHDSKMSLYEAYSSASFTREAAPAIISFTRPSDFDLIFQEKSVIQLAKERGYETLWLSNQYRIDPYEGVFADYVALLVSDVDKSYFTVKPYGEDLDLIPMLKNVHKEDKKQFIIIHLVGSHFSYSDRYDEVDEVAIKGASSQDVDYDRSVHHTDRVLRGIYNVIKDDKSSVLFYTSDHGEIIGKGHGFDFEERVQFEVPYFTINQSSQRMDSIVGLYTDTLTNKINNASTSYILSEIMGYKVSDEIRQRAIKDGRYAKHGDGEVHEIESMKTDEVKDINTDN